MLVAVLFLFPIETGRPKPSLPRALRSIRGWKRLMPSKTRKPLPFFVVCAVALNLCQRNRVDMAVCWLVMVDCYLRPSELIEMKKEQVIPPQPGMHKVVLLLNPGYEKKFSNTGELDESLQISRGWIGEALLHHWGSRPTRGRLWNFDLAGMRKEFLATCHASGLSHLNPVLYMARHTGASVDRLEDRLSLMEVQRRGRWRSETSVRRYEKRGMVQEVSSSLSDQQKVQFVKAEFTLPSTLKLVSSKALP